MRNLLPQLVPILLLTVLMVRGVILPPNLFAAQKEKASDPSGRGASVADGSIQTTASHSASDSGYCAAKPKRLPQMGPPPPAWLTPPPPANASASRRVSAGRNSLHDGDSPSNGINWDELFGQGEASFCPGVDYARRELTASPKHEQPPAGCRVPKNEASQAATTQQVAHHRADEPLAMPAPSADERDGHLPVPNDEAGNRMSEEVIRHAVDYAHASCFDGDPFPSAKKCQKCHPGHYREWSVSPHAYAQLSPIFNAMSNRLIQLSNGTLGDFCIRCHTPVGMALGEPINMSNLDRHPTAREGVTCVDCHRINQAWGKGAGRQALVAGGLTEPVYGPLGSEILAEVLANPERFGVLKTDPNSEVRGRDIHRASIRFFYQTTSAMCGACHDVFAPNGFRLEDAFSEFKESPAAREKCQSCQDCHMGVQPGVASGYAHGPAAKLGNVDTRPRKRTNHMFIGPDYSIVHPGLFPHNPRAVKEQHAAFAGLPAEEGLATMREWLMFDYKMGWGTPDFEGRLKNDSEGMFPDAWKDQARRYRARDILNDQFELLKEANVARHQVLSTGYQMGDIQLEKVNHKGIHFRVLVFNGTDGHGVPTGFDAERLVFLRVSVMDATGRLVFLSGDLDPNGDVRDSHSLYVHNGEIPIDRQLFSLQTRFLTRNVRGGEREQVLAVSVSLDPLPFIRPETRPFTVLGRPLGARKHKKNIEVGGHRWAQYRIDPKNLTGHGPYFARVQLIAGMVPVNLVHEISHVGFDYYLSAREVAERVVEGHQVLHERAAVFPVHQ